MVKGLRYILLLLLSLLCVQCRHKELCYSKAVEVEVRFDWSRVQDQHVAGMTTYFYPIDNGSSPVRRDFKEPAGGTISLREGRYRVVAFNNSSAILQHRGEERYETLESFTRNSNQLTGALLAQGPPSWDEGKTFRLQPEPFYAGRVTETRITPQADGTPRQVITIVMEPRYREVRIRLTNVQGLQGVHGISASMGGAVSGYLIGIDKWAKGSIHHPVVMKWDDHKVSGDLIVYELIPKADGGRQELTLYIVMTDGKGYTYDFDVTDQVESQKGEPVVYVTLDKEIKLPRTDEAAHGGLDVTVESWERMYVTIDM